MCNLHYQGVVMLSPDNMLVLCRSCSWGVCTTVSVLESKYCCDSIGL